jgi:hypothetical protein
LIAIVGAGLALTMRLTQLAPNYVVGGDPGGYVSLFYQSFYGAGRTLWRGQILEAKSHGKGPAFTVPDSCGSLSSKPPHIILIHQESIIPRSFIPGLGYEGEVGKMFRSADGVIHPLRVEVYGGGSWLTEFSIMSGISTRSFGEMRPFLLRFMSHKLKDTVPHALKRCGYRTAFFSPTPATFITSDKFYKSIGFDDFFDRRAQNSQVFAERDRFYFNNAVDYIAKRVANSEGPTFALVQTMAAHWPYDFTFAPDVEVPGSGPSAHPEVHEYLRRLSMAQIDYDALLTALKERMPGESFLIVQYGDHQPNLTKHLIGWAERNWRNGFLPHVDQTPLAFITYYAAQGVNYRVPALPSHEVLDVPYLGSVMLNLAGLPLSPSHQERLRIMALCDGAYYGCPKRDEILTYHRRLIDSGLVMTD